MAYPHAKLAKYILALFPPGFEMPLSSDGKRPIMLLITNAIYGLPPSGALYQDYRNNVILNKCEFITDKGVKFQLQKSEYMADTFYAIAAPSVEVVIVTDDFEYTGPDWFISQMRDNLDKHFIKVKHHGIVTRFVGFNVHYYVHPTKPMIAVIEVVTQWPLNVLCHARNTILTE